MATHITKSKKLAARSAVKQSPEVLSAMSTPLIFVSHDSRDAELAEAFSKLLSSVSAGMLKSFRSSDKKGTQGIEFGVEWYPEVMSKIDSASDVVCLLTPRSLERPWILYEAGVAKGKRNTPVYGVALGVSLSKAASGPFAQFQNCDEEADSLNKLVLQLMDRVSGAEPDLDTVRMQVDAFKTKADELTKGLERITKPQKGDFVEVEGSSVAKLFEEVKVMFRDLPMRIDERSERNSRFKSHRVPPGLFFEFDEIIGGPEGEGVGLLMLASMFRDDLPWLYELGMEAYRSIISGNAKYRQESLTKFAHACDMTARHPMFREFVRRDAIELLRDMDRFIDRITAQAMVIKPERTTPSRKKSESS